MPKNTVFDNDDVVLWYHTASKIVHHKVKRPIMGDRLRNVLDLGYELLKRNGAQKWLSDDRLLGPFSREDQQWCEEVWFPKTRDAGWRYWAIVLPEKVLGKMSLQYFERKYSEQGISARFFQNDKEGLQWLMLQEELSLPFESTVDPEPKTLTPPERTPSESSNT